MKLYLILYLSLFVGCQSAGSGKGSSGSSSQYCGFERAPYIMRANLKSGSTIMSEILLFGLHAKPDAVWPELNMLDDVMEETALSENMTNVIGLGDFNASCGYLSDAQHGRLDLTNKAYSWIIGNSSDTNVASSVCAYDRIIHKSSLSPTTSGVYTGTGSISDHYPVYADFTTNGQTFKLAAFNLERFGPSKASDSSFVNTVKNFIATKDLVLLQEITTTDDSLVNLLVPSGYDIVISERLGTTSYKEQYAYVYNSKIEMVKEWVYGGSLCTNTYNEANYIVPPTSGGSDSCTSDGYYCGINPYLTQTGQCWATKSGSKVRTRDCCCGR